MKRNGIGIGHNSGAIEPKYHNEGPCVLDYSPTALAQKRRLEAIALNSRGQCCRKALAGTLAVKVADHHKRFNLNGQARLQMGSADGISAAAPDDALADHLHIAADVVSYDVRGLNSLAVHAIDDTEEDEETEVLGADDIEVPEGASGPASPLLPGILYSTASAEHVFNITAPAEEA